MEPSSGTNKRVSGLPEIALRTAARGGFTPWNVVAAILESEKETKKQARESSPGEGLAYELGQSAAEAGFPAMGSWSKISSPRVKQLLGETVKPWQQSPGEFVKSVWAKLGGGAGRVERPEFQQLTGARLADVAKTENILNVTEQLRNELMPGTNVKFMRRKDIEGPFPYSNVELNYKPTTFGKEPNLWLSLGKRPQSLEDLAAAKYQMESIADSEMRGHRYLTPRVPSNTPTEPFVDSQLRDMLLDVQIRNSKDPLGPPVDLKDFSLKGLESLREHSSRPDFRSKAVKEYLNAINIDPALALRMENTGRHLNYNDLLSEYIQESLAKEAINRDIEVHPELVQRLLKKLKLPQSK